MFKYIYDVGDEVEEFVGTKKDCVSKFCETQKEILNHGFCDLNLEVVNLKTNETVYSGFCSDDGLLVDIICCGYDVDNVNDIMDSLKDKDEIITNLSIQGHVWRFDLENGISVTMTL